MSDQNFPKGLFFSEPHKNAPSFVKGRISVKRQEFIDYLKESNEEWLNFSLKVSKQGKAYVEIDTWKPDSNRQAPQSEPTPEAEAPNKEDDDLPFNGRHV